MDEPTRGRALGAMLKIAAQLAEFAHMRSAAAWSRAFRLLTRPFLTPHSNPQVSYVPEENLWALWHIGDGHGSPKNCNHSSAEPAGGAPRRSPAGGAGSSQLHLANSPYGPWTPFTDWALPSCNNPTQMKHPNGTWFIICDR